MADSDAKVKPLLYQTIIDDLLKAVEEGAFSFDKPLCTESSLMERYGVSRITARHAVGELENRGVLYRKRGAGSFVCRDVYDKRASNGTGSTGRVFAFLFPFNLTHTGLTAMCQSANRFLLERGCYASTYITEDGPGANGRGMLHSLVQSEVAGVAYYPKTANYHLDLLNEFVFRGKPAVVIDLPVDCPYVSSVSSDNLGGAKAAAEHLIALGHQRIAYFSGVKPEERPTVRDRVGGYVRALQEAGLPISPDWLTHDLTEERRAAVSENGRTGLQTAILRARALGVTAMLCEHDQFAFETILACRELRIRVPEDLSVCGFDHSEWAGTVPGGITSVRQDMETIGRKTAELLSQPDAVHHIEHVAVPTSLVVGSTTGPAPKREETKC